MEIASGTWSWEGYHRPTAEDIEGIHAIRLAGGQNDVGSDDVFFINSIPARAMVPIYYLTHAEVEHRPQNEVWNCIIQL